MGKKSTPKKVPDYDIYFGNSAYPFNVGERYVYFDSLEYAKSKSGIRTYKEAEIYLTSNASQLDRTNNKNVNNQSRMDKALSFLLKAANYERKKEEQLIKLFLERFPDSIPPGIADIQDDYLKLIAKLNVMIKGVAQFKEQIAQEANRANERKKVEEKVLEATKHIKDEQEKKAMRDKIVGEYVKNKLAVSNGDKYGTSTAINSIFSNNSNISIITKIIIETYGDRLFILGKKSLELNSGAMNALIKTLIDKANELFIIKQGSKVKEYGYKKNTQQYEEEIRKLITEENGEFQQFLSNLENSPMTLDPALSSMAKQMGMDKMSAEVKNINQKIQNLKKRLEVLYKKNNPNGTKQGFKDWLAMIGADEETLKDMYRSSCNVSVQPYYASEQITLMEMINASFGGTLGGNKNPTNDYLAGKLFFTFTVDEESNKKIQQIEENLQKKRIEQFNKIQTTTTLASYKENIETLRTMREEQQKILQEGLKDITSIEKNIEFFLSNVNIHGSIKGYITIGEKQREREGLQGASFGENVLEQLSIIQTTMGDILDIGDINWLLFAMLNAGSQAIGKRYKRSLEDYFSTMIGFLMFNDAQLAVEDVANQVENTNADNFEIHLYTINGIYMPNSFVLQKTYEALTKAATDIESNTSGAGGIHATLYTYNKGPINDDKILGIDDWERTSNAALSVTKLDMHFLAGMLDIINQINAAMG